MSIKTGNIRQSIRDRLIVPLEGKLKEESDRVEEIATSHGLRFLHVTTGVEAGLSEEEIVRKVRKSEALGKTRFEINVFLKRGTYPSEEEIKQVNKEFERIPRGAKQVSPDDEKDETFTD